MTTPDSGGPLDPLDEPTPTLLHLTDEEHAAGLRRRDHRAKVARAVILRLLRSNDATWAERNAAEARADELRREVEHLSSRCYLLAGLAVVGWATVAGLLLSS